MGLALGCQDPMPSRPLPDGTSHTDSQDSAPADDSADSGDSAPAGPCPADMVLVEERVCIHRYEAALEEWDGAAWVDASPYLTVDGRRVRAVAQVGRVPQAYISGEEAAAACAEAGARLCTDEEWLAACQGPEGWTYPYGDSYEATACNTSYPGGHPVVDYFGTSDGVWDSAHMNHPGINQQPDTVDAAGDNPGCESAWGAQDMHGNLHEWTADATGTFRGGFYADASINGPGCLYRTTAHTTTYHDYSTGFRCCADPTP
ncbi:MAG: SUMF1/EgtB/PvdO family nonheme iron enzyme [Alphaproteobacteria bacterium]|nr:SUMF1/EgtB/PvdO family nonheme iron enzyme [Alphaproteobacteria bacterium]MCB9796842.1 SUMF1/EgtB/PvdO family nonheme iron enzyme [Alphaproteobacteria bacterium]